MHGLSGVATSGDGCANPLGVQAMLESEIEAAASVIRAHVQQLDTSANVSAFGAVDISPVHLAVCITTDSDAMRDKFAADQSLDQIVRDALRDAGYPREAILHIAIAFESQETVDRDWDGNWRHAMK